MTDSQRQAFEKWWAEKHGASFASMPGAMGGAFREVAENAWKAALASVSAEPTIPIELSSVAETLAEGDGFWRSCSGCHETSEGYETGHYPYSTLLKCVLGGGCSECGGFGAVWDNTDYEAMGRDFERSLSDTPTTQQAQE